jgi:FMN phosphatase YigB (HAD superfamily)
MVGDNFDKDIAPALAAGIKPVWLTASVSTAPDGVTIIGSLSELLS